MSKPERVGLLSAKDHSLNTVGIARESYDSFGAHASHHVYSQNLKSVEESMSSELRKTIKFWVLPSNFTAVKRRILRDFDEYRFDGQQSKSLEESGTVYETIYFDTDSLSLYNKRILQVEQSMLFRYRWYETNGSVQCKNGFMEQKLRKEEWRGEISQKLRFQMDPKFAPKFMRSGPSALSTASILTSPSAPSFMHQFYQDTQKWGGKLRHTLRTEYRRTVYKPRQPPIQSRSAPPSSQQQQQPQRMVLSFDEGITLKDISNLTWEQALDPSVAVEPFKTFCFPLGVLEVKLYLDTFDDINHVAKPDWIKAMQNAGLIIEVDKFSKYCTGVSVMNLGKIVRVPSWIAAVKTLMEVELARKGQEWFSLDKLPKWTIQENVSVPTRVEPREFMANERTLLKWVRMCFLALFVGLGLLGFQYEPITGSVLIIFSLILLFRSYWMYRIRLKMLLERNFQDIFHDPWGPPLLVALFLLPTITYLAYSLGLWSLHF